MDPDDYEAMLLDEQDEFITPSPSGEDHFDERTGQSRAIPLKIVDKNFFNDFPDLFDDDN